MNRLIFGILFFCTAMASTKAQTMFSETVIDRLQNGELEVTRIKMDDNDFGEATWFRRADKSVKAKYFASNNPFETYRSWKRNGHQILGVCSGAYLGENQQLKGLSISGGQIGSREFNPDLDGLVIVEKVGGIRVVNLEKGPITIYYGSGNSPRTKKRLDPKNQDDLEELLSWGVEANATMFQTHLLAWKDKVKPDVFTNNAFNKSKSRKRFLALVYDDLNELHFVIVDVNQNLSVGKAAVFTTKYFLKHRRVESLVALINIDRHDDRPMETYFNRRPVSGVDADRVLEDYQNILVFYR